MSKKRTQYKLPSTAEATIETAQYPLPRRYTPPQCSACTELRPKGKEYTQVYSTKREAGHVIRYCRCMFCGNTYKSTEQT